MAPKQAEKIENPHVGSSSEEDDEESGSSGEESESSGEDSKKDESSDDDGETLSKLTQKSVAPVAAKKPESDSEVSESESDSDPEPAEKKTKPLNTVGTKTKPETSGSAAVTLLESSTAKRSLKQTEDESAAAKKKTKTSNTEHAKKPAATTDEEVKKISGDEAKKMFQRLFSGTDEIAMLQGFLDFTSTRGDPYENMDAFCDNVKTLIDFNATKSQIVTKLQRCKKKFVNMVKNSLKKGKTEDKIRFSKDLDQKAFDLSRKIWGVDGVFPAKPRKKSKDSKLPHASPSHAPRREEEFEIPKAIAVNTHLSSSREIASYFKTENLSVFSLDESTIATGWDMVEDGPKKRQMEEKMKKLKAMQVELCLQRSGLVDSTARMIFKENASS
uniref:Mediator-associated protein 1 n=1 Tax=Noccaea caerulescens TaxID=107243 RepID=A0A1J3FPF1_NOCCA